MAVPLLTKAKGGGMEQRFKDRVQETANHLLSDPIANGRNAKRAELRVILGNEMTSKRVGLKGTRFQIPHQRPEVVGKVGLKHLDADLVDARSTTVALDSFKAIPHQPVGDTSRKGVGFNDLGHESLQSRYCRRRDWTGVAGRFLADRRVARKRTGRAIWWLQPCG